MNLQLKSFLPHLIAIGLFLIISISYFYPALNGYAVKSHDVKTYKGMSKELIDFRAENGEEALWTNSMFGGMPGNQISIKQNVLTKKFRDFLRLWLPYPIGVVFLYFLGFYILLLSLKLDYKLAIIGAIAFGFSTYFFVIIQAGHITKTFTIAFMAPTLAGIILAYRGRLIIGLCVFALFLALELLSNHLQITYYFIFIILAVAISEMIRFIRAGEFPKFMKISFFLLAISVLPILTSLGNLWGTIEYGKHTTRGKSELTNNKVNKTSGLDRDYVTAWSYGKGETFSLMLPYVKGGANVPLFMLHESQVEDERLESLSGDMNSQIKQQVFNQVKNETSYWGNQSFTSGNDYVGIIVVFLALLALFFVKDTLKWALLSVIILSVMLSWGKNMMWLTDFFLDYIPGYNKFRTVSMILVIAELCLPILAMLFLGYLVKHREEINQNINKFYVVSGAFLLFLILLAVTPETFFNFFPKGQGKLTLEYLQQVQPDMSAEQQVGVMSFYNGEYYPFLKKVRISIFQSNVYRGLAFFAIATIVILGFIKDKINILGVSIVLGLLTIVDMWSINSGYINSKDYDNDSRFWTENTKGKIPYNVFAGDEMIFQREAASNPIIVQEAEQKIAQAKEESEDGLSPREIAAIKYGVLNKYTNFRVFSVSNPFNESRTSYFYKSLGGYHGAKLKRYQELIDSCLSKNNQKVMDMLNAKYVVQYQNDPKTGEQNNTLAQQRGTALGNAWFVNDVNIVENADEEIVALKEENGFDPANTAVVDKRYSDLLEKDELLKRDKAATITMESYAPNYLVYNTKSNTNQIAVFSEIFYDLGWEAYIDGEPVEHFRTNYVLRGMSIPAGEHKIEFKYSLKSYSVASIVSPLAFIAILALLGYGVFSYYRENKQV
ncbi:MAG: YfhO family protein [Flavobacteriales bacterium]|jgi:hypothetical protein|nr:YfhO family protein [Flavobacteriales bacterium]